MSGVERKTAKEEKKEDKKDEGKRTEASPKPERKRDSKPRDKKEKKDKKDKEGKEKKKKSTGKDGALKNSDPAPTKGIGSSQPLPSVPAGKYEVGKQVGGITLGGEFHYAIYEATSKETGKPVVWKTIKKTLDPQQGDEPTYALRRDLASVRTLSHPNLARLLECFEDTEFFYLVYESFAERLPKSRVWSEAETRSFAAQILSLIEYLHSQKIYGSKLELKPEKLYLDGQTLKMEDVGINQAAYPTEDKLRSIGKGNKSYYVSPELLMCEPETPEVSQAADVWALGAMVFFFLTGQPPFDAESEPALFKKIIAGADELKFPDAVSEPVRALIKLACARDIKKRPSVAQIKAEGWLKGKLA